MTTQLDLADLKAKAEAATPGPWTYADHAPGSFGPAWLNSPEVKNLAVCDGTRRSDTHGFCLRMNDGENEANAAYIVAACNAVPALIAEIERRDQGGEPFMFAYEDVDQPGRWKAFRERLYLVVDKIGKPLYDHPAGPDPETEGLRERVRVLEEVLNDVLDNSGARPSKGYHALKYLDAVEKAEALLSRQALKTTEGE